MPLDPDALKDRNQAASRIFLHYYNQLCDCFAATPEADAIVAQMRADPEFIEFSGIMAFTVTGPGWIRALIRSTAKRITAEEIAQNAEIKANNLRIEKAQVLAEKIAANPRFGMF